MMIARLVLWGVGQGPWVKPARGPNPLALVERHVARRYPKLARLAPLELNARLDRRRDDIVIFDVRSEEEFAVSHIIGAVRLDPRGDARNFQMQNGARIQGRDVVVYCSVGLRSASLARRLDTAMAAAGARGIANLSGGIFRWSNEGLPVVAETGHTRAVHPFDAFWSRFLQP
jgi:rhodanese-related sulfurtransferase